MKKLLLIGGMVTITSLAQASLFTYDFNSGFNNGGVLPDGNPAGWFDTRNITGIAPDDTILDVNVRLNIAGGYNGDLYGYLVHSSGFAVLLNRSGRTDANGFGYNNAGFDITLDGQANTYNNDIHLYNAATPSPTFSGGKLTGTWLEDGRSANPATVNGTETRDATLLSFNTLAANGNWTLFLADMAGGDQSTLISWGLDITVVPEPITWALMIFGGVLGVIKLGRCWRFRKCA